MSVRLSQAKFVTQLTIPLILAAGCELNVTDTNDHSCLNDTYDEQAVDWARRESGITRQALQQDSRFDSFLQDATDTLTRPGRKPRIQFLGDTVVDYHQDRDRPLGVLRSSAKDAYFDGEDRWQTLIDFDALSANEDRKWFFGGMQCFENRCLVVFSDNGKDQREIREFDLESRSFVEDGFNVPLYHSYVWWLDRDRVLIGSEAAGGKTSNAELHASIRLWRRGEALEDAPVLVDMDESDAFLSVSHIDAETLGGFIVNRQRNYFESDFLFVDFEGNSKPLPLPDKALIPGTHQGRLLVRANQDWAVSESLTIGIGTLVSVDLNRLIRDNDASDTVVLYEPGSNEAIRGVLPLGERIVVELLRDYRSAYVELSPSENGWHAETLTLPTDKFISILGVHDDGLLLNVESPLDPPALNHYDLESQTLRNVRESAHAFDASNFQMQLLETKSRDGTKISYTVIHDKNMEFNGKRPTLVYGYGGFDISVTPRYEPVFGKLWLEKGGIYVHAYLRGGGERGPRWHQEAQLENRQRSYDDMIAILEDLHTRKVSSPDTTGIVGRSNGGLMVANILVQRPDLINAAIIGGPLTDMLNFDRLHPGAIWAAEFGDPRDADAQQHLTDYSPLHRLQADASYPAPLIITSTDDDRVLPGHARRFKARMQELGHEAYYFEDEQGGHYWELFGGPPPGDWRLQSLARTVEFIYLARALGLR